MTLDLGEDGFDHVDYHAVSELLIALEQGDVSGVHVHAMEAHGPGTFCGSQLTDPTIYVVGTGLGGRAAAVCREGDGVSIRRVDAFPLATLAHDADSKRLGGFG